MKSPVGGIGFDTVAVTSKQWHERASAVGGEKDLPLLGLFKERADGAGHSFGTTAVRKYVELTEEKIAFDSPSGTEQFEALRLLPLGRLDDASASTPGHTGRRASTG